MHNKDTRDVECGWFNMVAPHKDFAAFEKTTRKKKIVVKPPVSIYAHTRCSPDIARSRIKQQQNHLKQQCRSQTARSSAARSLAAAAAAAVGCRPPAHLTRRALTPSTLQPVCCRRCRPLAAAATILGGAPSPPSQAAEGRAHERGKSWGNRVCSS